MKHSNIKSNINDKKMKRNDNIRTVCTVIGIIFSLLSLIVSFINFKDIHRKAEMVMTVGEKITFSTNGDIFQVALPIVIYNEGNTNGVLYDIELEIYNYDNPSKSFYLPFSRELDVVDADQALFGPVNTSYPIIVGGKQSVYYYIDFALESKNIVPEPGIYELRIKANDNPRTQKKLLYRMDFNFSKENYDFLLKEKFATMFWNRKNSSYVDLSNE